MQPHHSLDFAKLATDSPDGGRIQIAPHFHLDAYTTLRWPYLHTTSGVVAVKEENKESARELVGAGLVSRGAARVRNASRPFALLHNLLVHPAHRGQGIASQLASWRIAHARQHAPDSLILALIQQDNIPSLAVARHWCAHFTGPLVQGAIPMRDNRPTISPLTVRSPKPEELSIFAKELNTFYASYQLYSPHTAESLNTWLAASPFPTPFRHYRVAVDPHGRLLAGAAIVEQYRLKSMQVRHAPRWLWWMNRLLHLIPTTGHIRPLSLTKVWFASGHHAAAQAVQETIRWEWRRQADTLLVIFDPRSPLSLAFTFRPWWPKTRFNLAVSEALPPSTLLYPI